METKYIVIAVIAIIAVAGGYFLLSNNHGESEYTSLLLSKSAYMEVPVVPNATHNVDKDGIFYYVDEDNGINVTSCNSNISKKSSFSKMNNIKNSTESNSKKIKENDVVMYEKNGTYYIFVKNTEYNNTIMLQSLNKDLLLSCWKSLKFHNPTDAFKLDNKSSASVVDVVQETHDVVGDVSSSYSESSTSSSQSVDYSSDSSDSGGASYSSWGSSDTGAGTSTGAATGGTGGFGFNNL